MARHDVFEGARARAMTALGLDEREFASLMGAVLSAIDLTIGTALADDALA
jgi:hypothetical protein